MVHDLAVDDRGQVTFTFLLSAEDPGTLARDARKAVQAVAGGTGVKITVAGGGAPARGAGARPRLAPRPPVPPPPSPGRIPHLRTGRGVSPRQSRVGPGNV